MARSGDEGIEQRLDRWVEAGRQFVDGVSGARPGSRGSARGSLRRSGSRLNPGELGRWVENKLEWLLDEEPDDDWREPWQPRSSVQQPQPQPQPQTPFQARSRRRRLEAVSRRTSRPEAPLPPRIPTRIPTRSQTRAQNPVQLQAKPQANAQLEPESDWPSDDLFTVPRWQRSPSSASEPGASEPGASHSAASEPLPLPINPTRPLPRSSRRR